MPNLSFQYKGKDRLVSGLPWLWLREAKIDIQKDGIEIYGDFVPFCKYPFKPKTLSDFETETSEKSNSDYVPSKKKIYKPEGVVIW
ncbi:21187_t:CDS:2 [Rhizophagus irregularis]|uniref:Uncharacterized protein n=1 Tax=Rhizophagus irregularis (strain DAOM 181602 / DAOM 197198 / MUCL 43194) TaxID=747089 RepID=U9UD79_RHIID|nr:21187_t:CDS:2 [Rhizophagus irregularis]